MNEAEIEAIAAKLIPAIVVALTPVVNAVTPPAFVPVENVAIDAVEQWVEHLLGSGAPPAPATPETAAARVSDLEQHVAALTIATRQAGSAALVSNKVAAAAAAAHAAPAN